MDPICVPCEALVLSVLADEDAQQLVAGRVRGVLHAVHHAEELVVGALEEPAPSDGPVAVTVGEDDEVVRLRPAEPAVESRGGLAHGGLVNGELEVAAVVEDPQGRRGLGSGLGGPPAAAVGGVRVREAALRLEGGALLQDGPGGVGRQRVLERPGGVDALDRADPCQGGAQSESQNHPSGEHLRGRKHDPAPCRRGHRGSSESG